jgi:hypothetical protein
MLGIPRSVNQWGFPQHFCGSAAHTDQPPETIMLNSIRVLSLTTPRIRFPLVATTPGAHRPQHGSESYFRRCLFFGRTSASSRSQRICAIHPVIRDFSRVELRVRIADTQLFIDIADTRPGIAEEHLQRLFDAFYQVDNPTRDQGQGVGLGLSIVQIISRLLDHTVTIQSQSGAGSSFSVRVPRGMAADKPIEATPLETRCDGAFARPVHLESSSSPRGSSSYGVRRLVRSYFGLYESGMVRVRAPQRRRAISSERVVDRTIDDRRSCQHAALRDTPRENGSCGHAADRAGVHR